MKPEKVSWEEAVLEQYVEEMLTAYSSLGNTEQSVLLSLMVSEALNACVNEDQLNTVVAGLIDGILSSRLTDSNKIHVVLRVAGYVLHQLGALEERRDASYV